MTPKLFYHQHFQISAAICLISLCSIIHLAQAFQGYDGIYCGKMSCYDVLEASRESSKDEINKLYRNLARKWHPDRFKDDTKKAEATEKFRQIATAYEILKDDESRREYNDMLDDPEQFYRHYLRYYSRRAINTAKPSVFVVLFFVMALISLYNYYGMYSKYNAAISYFAQEPKHRLRAIEIAKQKGLLPISAKRNSKDQKLGDKRGRLKSKDEIRAQEEAIIREMIECNMDIRGSCAKPDIKNLWIFSLPIAFFYYLIWKVRWIYLYDIKGEAYGQDEKIYLIAKHLGVSEEQLCTDEDVDSLLRQELWIKEKGEAWKKRKEDEMREKLAQNPAYKRYRRYMKKGGPGQITFADD